MLKRVWNCLKAILFRNKNRLSVDEIGVLLALHQGAALKSHRYLDGRKVYQLHPLSGLTELVDSTTIQRLRSHNLIQSNHKFPAATYALTEVGMQRLDETMPILP